MDILSKIALRKIKEIELKKQSFSISHLEQLPGFKASTNSLKAALKQSDSGIIAEFKRRSPSKAVINQSLYVDDVAQAYQNAGATAMSVLTDNTFFGGSLEDLILAKSACSLPILRKEFIIDPYQVIESKAYGADAILLIAAILDEKQLIDLSQLAKQLQLDVLVEVHNSTELIKATQSHADIIGVNNRNLKTFKVSLDTSIELSSQIPTEFLKISESGISSPQDILQLQNYGFEGFLIGEQFMKSNTPGKEASKFIHSISGS
ncbi:MAG: indole-3-glycerol phosphate synthase [Bacteroidetes bacterium MedPE-SWsnd-G2]|nr:MAG: indole-3-glycerol phosphate synthase [Bacteroidetes bacterium MedPE-SWsnd-G2]